MQSRHTLLLTLLVAPVAAQTQTKIVPSIFATVEGSSRHTYPFGRDNAALQILIDASQLTKQAGLVNAASFRPEGDFSATYVGYTKGYKLTAYTTPVAAATMTTDPVANTGNTSATVVFNASLNVPNAPPPVVLPQPFVLRIPFLLTPYPYDGSKGNLLLHIETTDLIAPPGTWVLDAGLIRKAAPEGIVTSIAEGCKNASLASLTLSINRATAIVGGSIDYALKASTAGSFPTAFALLGVTNASPGLPLDLSILGMPSCKLAIDILFNQVANETGGVYPTVGWPIPPNPAFAGVALYAQALGWSSPSAALVGSVMSEGMAVILGGTAAAGVDAQSIFYTASTNRWSIGTTGTYVPVTLLDGAFP